jgi:hypothetical protein
MFELSDQPLSRSGRFIRYGLLGIASAPLLGAYWYNQGYRLPFLGCPVRHLTGIPCPTCGMTRSFMAIAQGHWSQALAHHWFGPILFFSFLVAAIHIAIELWCDRPLLTFYRELISRRSVQLGALSSLLLYHSYRLYDLAQSGALRVAVENSPLGHVLLSIGGAA